MSIYLDYNATAPVRPEVIAVMAGMLGTPSNPSSVHKWGRKGRKHLEDARANVAAALSCFPHEVIFTSSGTEANNLALSSYADIRVAVCATEHVSVLKAVPTATVLPVTGDGQLRYDALRAWLREDTFPSVVSVMLANNETGFIQPIASIVEVVREYGGIVHCDASQALGKIPVDMGVLGVDMLTLSAHKMGGPPGAAALVVRQGVDIIPQLKGGRQEFGKRAGTENLPAICGFSEAVTLARMDNWQNQLRVALDEMEATVLREVPGAKVICQDAPRRLPTTSALLMPGVLAETQLMHFDLEGIGVSAGSACSSGRVTPSHVAQAMGFSESEAACILRVSGGWNTKREDIERFTQSWLALAKRLVKAA